MATIYKQRCLICGHIEESLTHWIAVKNMIQHNKKHKEKQNG